MALTDSITVMDTETKSISFTSESILMDNFTKLAISLTFANRSNLDMDVSLEVSSSKTGGYTDFTGSDISITNSSDDTETYLIDSVSFKYIRVKCIIHTGSLDVLIEATRKY